MFDADAEAAAVRLLQRRDKIPGEVEIPSSLSGDVDTVITAFCMAVWEEVRPGPNVTEWVAQFLCDVKDDVSHPARRRLGLRMRGRGKPRDNDNRLSLLLQFIQLAMARGHGKGESMDLAAKVFHRSRKSIEDRVKGWTIETLDGTQAAAVEHVLLKAFGQSLVIPSPRTLSRKKKPPGKKRK